MGQGDVPWTVLADPEGNVFGVLEPPELYRDTGPIAAVVVDCADPRAMARFWGAAIDWTVQEVARLEGLGATRTDVGQGEVSWVVMTDPAGNEFCVLGRG